MTLPKGEDPFEKDLVFSCSSVSDCVQDGRPGKAGCLPQLPHLSGVLPNPWNVCPKPRAVQEVLLCTSAGRSPRPVESTKGEPPSLHLDLSG